MTRFARAKGSKSSNERIPEKATSWGEMKRQLLDKNKEIDENKQRQEAANRRNANYQAFLEERRENESKETKWADFPGVINGGATKKNKISIENGDSSDEEFFNLKEKLNVVLNRKDKANSVKHVSDSDDAPEEHSAKEKVPEIIVKKTKNKKKLLKIVVDKEEKLAIKNEATSKATNLNENHTKKKRKGDDIEIKNQKKFKKEADEEKLKNLSEAELTKIEKKKLRRAKQVQKKKAVKLAAMAANPAVKEGESKEKDKKIANVGKKKNNPKVPIKTGKIPIKQKNPEDLTEKDLKKLEKNKQRKIRQLEKRKKIKELKKQMEEQQQLETNNEKNINQEEFKKDDNNQERYENNNNPNIQRKPFQKPLQNQNKKKPKPRDNKEHERKKRRPERMIINGNEVDIDYVDGFPVKKEDAERLRKLRREMISKGLPRSEINIALKLERRKAEKAFAREKKKVCFNCRKSGHNLSDCQELDNNQVAQSAGTGICFKCGSTEHTHFECKVVRGQDFKFAQCFICNEQGHIAKQCPDNARGLYPKGGACKVCGDVTHLKKDCPKYQAQQEQLQSNIHLETLDGRNPDILEANENQGSNILNIKKKPNKIIKF